MKLEQIIEIEKDRFSLWLPVLFGTGIAFYFSLSFEPSLWIGGILFAVALLLTFINRFWFLPFLFLTGGFLCIQTKAHMVSAPKLHWNSYAIAVEATVAHTEFLNTGQRMTLTDLDIPDIPDKYIPKKIRVSTRSSEPKIYPGSRVSFKANLTPPSLAFIPGGYDFARLNWFRQIGGVGYTTSKVKILSTVSETSLIQKLRMAVGHRIKSLLPKDQSSVIMSLTIGEQSSVSQNIYNIYRDSGIAHVLSVSGLHLMLVAGLVLGFFRFFFNLFPSIALRINVRKVSAVLALIISFLYLLISGMAIPAERAFIMLSFMLIALLLDRQALSIRSVCWAGFLVLLFSPESLISASFQLSFGATLAIIAAYEALKKPVRAFLNDKSAATKFFLRLLIGFLIINIAANLSTSLYALYHFNRFATHSVLGNFLTSSLLSLYIMPLLIIAMFLMPLGLDALPFKLAGSGIGLVNDMMAWVAGLPYASIVTQSYSVFALFLMTFGGLWLCLWRSRIRYIGFIPLFLSMFSPLFYVKPDALASSCGHNFAIQKTDGNYLFNGKDKMVRRTWAERNGIEPRTYDFKKNALDLDKIYDVNGAKIIFAPTTCVEADIAFLNSKEDFSCPLIKKIVTKKDLCRNGTYEVFVKKGKIRIETSSEYAGMRLWNPNTAYAKKIK